MRREDTKGSGGVDQVAEVEFTGTAGHHGLTQG